MGNLSGWGLTGRLLSKHFGALGDKISEAIANFDPETATQADRDRIQATLQSTATKLAQARAAYAKEHDDVEKLKSLLATDEKALEILGERLQAGTISEATVTLFCDELEANKAKLPNEVQEETDAKVYMQELEQLVGAFSKQLADFDAVAKKALQQLASAKSQMDLQAMRAQRQNEMNGLKNQSQNSTALNSLTRRAQSLSNQAEGMKIVTDINQKPLDQAAEIDSIRKSISNTAAESPMDRLKRLSGKV